MISSSSRCISRWCIKREIVFFRSPRQSTCVLRRDAHGNLIPRCRFRRAHTLTHTHTGSHAHTNGNTDCVPSARIRFVCITHTPTLSHSINEKRNCRCHRRSRVYSIDYFQWLNQTLLYICSKEPTARLEHFKISILFFSSSLFYLTTNKSVLT